jgi:hypothetical protein
MRTAEDGSGQYYCAAAGTGDLGQDQIARLELC